MMRRNSLSLAARAATVPEEDVNPNAYITNIADCMLVLVLGLLVALVTRYGVDLTATDIVEKENRDLIGLEVDLDADHDGVVDGNYEARGTVYYDNATGNYYMVTD